MDVLVEVFLGIDDSDDEEFLAVDLGDLPVELVFRAGYMGAVMRADVEEPVGRAPSKRSKANPSFRTVPSSRVTTLNSVNSGVPFTVRLIMNTVKGLSTAGSMSTGVPVNSSVPSGNRNW